MPLHKDLTGTDLHEPKPHKTSHENGGSDEISVAGLSGQLADAQPTTLALISDATAAGRALMDDADAAAQLVTLGAAALAGATFTGDVVVPDEAYGSGWDGSAEVPTKNAIYDKIESLVVGGGSGAETLITETVVGVGGAANVDFTSISSSYRDLRVVVRGRCDDAAIQNLKIRFNNDSGANYDTDFFYQADTTFNGDDEYAQTSAHIGYVNGTGSPSNSPSGGDVTINDYRGTTFNKGFQARGWAKGANTAGNFFSRSLIGEWRSTSAINQVTVFPQAGSFIAGTVVSLYGRM